MAAEVSNGISYECALNQVQAQTEQAQLFEEQLNKLVSLVLTKR